MTGRLELSKLGRGKVSSEFKEISESPIFDLSGDRTSQKAKISHFQNMLGFTQILVG